MDFAARKKHFINSEAVVILALNDHLHDSLLPGTLKPLVCGPFLDMSNICDRLIVFFYIVIHF